MLPSKERQKVGAFLFGAAGVTLPASAGVRSTGFCLFGRGLGAGAFYRKGKEGEQNESGDCIPVTA